MKSLPQPGPERVMDLSHIDAEAFARDVDALHADLVANLGPADLGHLRRYIATGRACTVLGYATAPLFPNPVSGFLISAGIFSQWIAMHHIGHRGYDRVPGMPPRLTSKHYAQGYRRYLDWFDWMSPDAWVHEHNTLHHPRTGEEADPDLVERNTEVVRRAPWPKFFKQVFVVLAACTWKYSYYAPNTVRELHRAKRARAGHPDAKSAEEAARLMFELADPGGREQWLRLVNPFTDEGRKLWFSCWAPYVALRFGLLPALFLPLGTWAWASVLINSLLAELITNVHSFMAIAPNHSGDDVPRFEGHTRDRGEYYVRQVAGSVNFPGGTDLSDFMHGYLGYQIEHHVWTDLPMLKYRQAQPRLQAICKKHGVPYVREGMLRRVGKLVGIMTGATSMPVGLTVPAAKSARRASA